MSDTQVGYISTICVLAVGIGLGWVGFEGPDWLKLVTGGWVAGIGTALAIGSLFGD